MKKHIAPYQVFISLFTFSMLSLLYSSFAVGFDNKKLNLWSILLLLASLVCLITQGVFTIKYKRIKKVTHADECTTALLHKAAYYTYMSIACLISLIFIAVSLIITINRTVPNLDSFLSAKVILGVFAIVQLVGSTLFICLYYFFNKKGEQRI